MKVLLRSIKTGLYYEEAAKWTSDQTAAFDFQKTPRAVEWVFAAGLENVEMLLTFVDPRFDLVLPIKGPRSLYRSSPTSEDQSLTSRNAVNPANHNNKPTRSSHE